MSDKVICSVCGKGFVTAEQLEQHEWARKRWGGGGHPEPEWYVGYRGGVASASGAAREKGPQ